MITGSIDSAIFFFYLDAARPPHLFLTVITVHGLCTCVYVRGDTRMCVCVFVYSRGTRSRVEFRGRGDKEDSSTSWRGVSENRNARCNAIHADAPRSPGNVFVFRCAANQHERFFSVRRAFTLELAIVPRTFLDRVVFLFVCLSSWNTSFRTGPTNGAIEKPIFVM